MDIRPFYSGSKIISGSGALDALSFELASVNAEKPLLIASNIERTAEKTVAKALKATAAVIGGICRLQSGEKNPAKTIAETFNRFGCDSLLAIGDADLINAVKAARVELSFGKAPAEIDFTQPAPPRRSVPFVSVAVLPNAAKLLPQRLFSRFLPSPTRRRIRRFAPARTPLYSRFARLSKPVRAPDKHG